MSSGTAQSFAVRVGEFDGPLDMLLHLIERRKLHISDVSLAQITDEYVSRIKELGDISREELADFIYIASTLLLIKSLWLLPGTKTTPEEQATIKDLEARLAIYQHAQKSGSLISRLFGSARLFIRGDIPRAIRFSYPKETTIDTIELSTRSVLASLPTRIVRPQVTISKSISIEEAINSIINKVEHSFQASFREHVGSSTERVSIIVHFLALLELVKRGSVTAAQDEAYSDIAIENHTPAVPKYG